MCLGILKRLNNFIHVWLKAMSCRYSNEPDKDVDGNGVVDFNDLVGTLANWGPC